MPASVFPTLLCSLKNYKRSLTFHQIFCLSTFMITIKLYFAKFTFSINSNVIFYLTELLTYERSKTWCTKIGTYLPYINSYPKICQFWICKKIKSNSYLSYLSFWCLTRWLWFITDLISWIVRQYKVHVFSTLELPNLYPMNF